MQDHINTFETKDTASAAQSSASGGGSSRLAEIEKAPPCPTYKKLLALQVIKRWHEKCISAESVDALTEIKMDFMDAKKPIQDLIGRCKAAIAEAEAAKIAFLTNAPKAPASKKRKTKGNIETKSGAELFAAATTMSEMIVEIPTCDLGSAISADPARFHPSKPLIFKLDTEWENATKNSQEQLTSMVESWMQARQSRTLPRVARKMVPSSGSGGVDILPKALFEKFFPMGAILPEVQTEATKGLFIPNLFAIESGYLEASAEKECSASIRIATTGNRQVVLARFQEVRTFLQAELVKTDNGFDALMDPSKIWNCLKSMDAEAMRKYKEMGSSIWFGSLAPHQALYTPAGFITVDHVLDGTVSGVSRRLLVGDITAADDLAAFVTQMQSVQNFPLQGMNDVIKMMMKETVVQVEEGKEVGKKDEAAGADTLEQEKPEG